MYAGVLPTHLTHPMCNPLCSVRACANRAFADSRDMDVEVFGSFANGLSTWSSDVDVCVTGLMTPDKVTGCECECVYVLVRVCVCACVYACLC